ncbi:hypothetical protein ZIOFF_065063 [Zingiber officinale]|uniref:Uncharacterized protein n=1 Tax=Zingiber officinale TaxID=94328 RepID=A0A8J5EWT2_ZINOF|nr:hypothetical protein ZIOFF_065063 [Zingiber officinale]
MYRMAGRGGWCLRLFSLHNDVLSYSKIVRQVLPTIPSGSRVCLIGNSSSIFSSSYSRGEFDTATGLGKQPLLFCLLGREVLLAVQSRDSVNPFVEQAVQYVIPTSKIESHGLPLTRDALASLPSFSSITFNRVASNGTLPRVECKPEVAKTRLGSLAAMTTSVVAALLHYLRVVILPFSSRSQLDDKIFDSDLDLVHIIFACSFDAYPGEELGEAFQSFHIGQKLGEELDVKFDRGGNHLAALTTSRAIAMSLP